MLNIIHPFHFVKSLLFYMSPKALTPPPLHISVKEGGGDVRDS